MGDKSSSPDVTSVSTQSAEQQAISALLSGILTTGQAAGVTPYTGEFVAPVSDLETQTASALSALLSVDPAAITAQYMEQMYPSAERLFKETTLPGVSEAYVGPGTFWGSERAGAESKAWTTFGEEQNKAIYGATEDALNRALAAAPTAASLGLQTRSVEQAELDALYNEFIRTSPESSPWLDLMMQFLGLTTTENIVEEAEPSTLELLLGSVS